MPQHTLKGYRLTESVRSYGCSCKLPQHQLTRLLETAGLDDVFTFDRVKKLNDDLVMVHNVDFFTPIIDDPYVQGKITACNVINDVYATATTNIISMLVMLALQPQTPLEVAAGLLEGFDDVCGEIQSKIIGGHTIRISTPLIGGCAIGIANPAKIVRSNGAKVGDDLVLTKPIGAHSILAISNSVQGPMSFTVKKALNAAIKCMTTTNKYVAETMNKQKVNAAIDISGFGLLGHSTEMAKQSRVDIKIDTIPIMKEIIPIMKILDNTEMPASGIIQFDRICSGEAAETAGGILLAVSRDNIERVLQQLKKEAPRIFPTVIGKVIRGEGKAQITKDMQIIEK